MKKVTVFYATKSKYKQEELDVISSEVEYVDPTGCKKKIGELIDFRVSDVSTDEPLEIDLEKMVCHKVRSAYKALLAPCIVEHAGLIFDRFKGTGYPGGLTQPMWDALLAESFIESAGSSGEKATARAVVGFCDGMRVRTFIGDTHGHISPTPKGSRAFYWDPIFCPAGGGGRTYAEITDGGGGLREKLLLSQSTKAITAFATFLAQQTGRGLFELR